MKDTVTVPQDISFGEHFRISVYQQYRNKMIRRLFIYVAIVGFLAGFLGVAVPGTASGSNEMTFSQIASFFIVPLFLFLFFTAITALVSFYIIQFKPHIIRGITYRFTHWGMERDGKNIAVSIPWRDFKEVKETRSFFFLRVREKDRDNIHVIQKRMFTDKMEAEAFKQFLDHNRPL
jgi:hypothetical protein